MFDEKKIYTLKLLKKTNSKYSPFDTLKLSDPQAILKRITQTGYTILLQRCDDDFKNIMIDYQECCYAINFSELNEQEHIALLVTDNNNNLERLEIFSDLGEHANVLFAINTLLQTEYLKDFSLESAYFGKITNCDILRLKTDKISYNELAKITGISIAGIMQIISKGDKYKAILDLLSQLDGDYLAHFFSSYEPSKRGVKSQKEKESVKKLANS